MKKILIIRFSSFGDVVQSLSIPSIIHKKFPDSEIHFITRSDYFEILKNHPCIDKSWSFERSQGLKGLWSLCQKLKKENFTHIYDAHNNLRSHIIHWFLNGPWGIWGLLKGRKFLRRPAYRWKRFFLFQLRINLYPQPFTGQMALLEPLKKWGVPFKLPPAPQIFFSSHAIGEAQNSINDFANNKTSATANLIALAPSASYQLKRWPPEYWKELIAQNPQWKFLLLGGPEDHFIEEIANISPQRTLNMAGKLSLEESSAALGLCQALISNDTGLMHVAEQRGMKCIALMGPTPFGYPSRSTTVIKEKKLACRPCTKHGQGPCVNKDFYHECLAGITPFEVSQDLRNLLQGNNRV